ncbi:MAG: quinol monooxygenase YgiN [Limisphaerales bacterium]|jgi:quinol monooxygenase YgiN
MLIRIVKMKVREEAIADFYALFAKGGARVEASNGCSHVQLMQGADGYFFSYSVWEDENKLNEYRNSAFFKATWPKLKAMFSEKAEAWSTSAVSINYN